MRVGDELIPHTNWTTHYLTTGSNSVKLNGRPIVRIGDLTSIHYNKKDSKQKHSSYQLTGSGFVKVEGSLVARTGDLIACGSTDGEGSSNATAG